MFMKKIVSSLLLLVFAVSVFAVGEKPLNASEVSKLDVSGKWSGKRYQYSWDKKEIIQTFEYEFELVQEGSRITGTTSIINPDGEYANMKIRGTLVGNKLHFEEYEITGEIKPNDMMWCYKSGELSFKKENGQLKMFGNTPSYMAEYYFPCSGGYTDLVQVDGSKNEVVFQQPNVSAKTSEESNLSIYPNPFIESTNISYHLAEDAKVSLQVMDIKGKVIANLVNEKQSKGNHSYVFRAQDAGYSAGIFIGVLTINGEVFSQQMVLVR